MVKVKYWFKKVTLITLAVALVAVGVNLFLAPHSIAAGGLTGLAVILEAYAGFDRAVVVWVGNAVMLLIALLMLGREVFFNTVIGAGLLPLFIALVPKYRLVNDTMLSMIVGSAIFGVAVSIMYSQKASSGGTAVPPLILKKQFGISTSLGLLLTDGVVVTLCLLVFDIDAFFYAILSIVITAIVMSYIENGTNKKKRVHIISSKHEEIAQDIMAIIGRGVTIISAKGAYSQQELPMLMVTINREDYQPLIEIVHKYDKEAFMITDVVADVHGKGFTIGTGTV
ncbi:MAG: YitT family protein [Symbiobacteriaceae bacterium]|nr:YitT family protein [Symbiobacteriaceae bacterium]